MKGLLLILTGAAACGKDAVAQEILKKYPNSSLIVTYTTRLPRTGEAEGVDHFFIDHQMFEQKLKQKELLEWVELAGNFYGTPKSEVKKILSDKIVIWRIEPLTSAHIKEKLAEFFDPQTAQKLFNQTLVVFLDVPSEERLQRLKDRVTKKGVSLESLQQRILKDEADLASTKGNFEYIVANHNGQLSQTVQAVTELVDQKLKN